MPRINAALKRNNFDFTTDEFFAGGLRKGESRHREGRTGIGTRPSNFGVAIPGLKKAPHVAAGTSQFAESLQPRRANKASSYLLTQLGLGSACLLARSRNHDSTTKCCSVAIF
jgi:hypothetical protein